MCKISCVILDLDNTLYDWVEMWYSSFEPMLAEVARISKLTIDDIKADFKKLIKNMEPASLVFELEKVNYSKINSQRKI